MFFDVIELAHCNIGCFGFSFEEVTREFVLAIVDFAAVRLETALNFDDSKHFFRDGSAQSSLVLGKVDRLAKISFEAEGALVVSERVWAIGIDDIFELRIVHSAATAGSIDEILSLLDIICGLEGAIFGSVGRVGRGNSNFAKGRARATVTTTGGA